MIALAAQCTMTVSVKYGLGMHQSLLSDADIVQTNFWSWIAQAIGIVDLAAARCAVIAFLLALQARTHRKGRWVLFFVGGLQGAINIAEIGVIFHQCNPPRKLWDMSVPGTCDLIDVCLHIGYFQGGKHVIFMTIVGFCLSLNSCRGRSRYLPCLLSCVHHRQTSANATRVEDWSMSSDERRHCVRSIPS